MSSPRGAFARTTNALLDEDPRVAVVLAEISRQYFPDAERRHPGRVVNVGIREQLLVSVGAGMALAGMRPVVHTFGPFLVERAFEQVKLDFAHQGVGGVLVGSGGSFDMAGAGRTHQSPGDVALMDTLDAHIEAPATADGVEAALRRAVASDGLHYVRVTEQVDRTPVTTRPGRLTAVRRGSGGVVVVLGPGLDAVLEATQGLDVTVLHSTTVRPFDAAGLRAHVGDRADVVLVEPWLAGTSSRVVADALVDVPHRLLALGVGRGELRRYGTPADHVRHHGLDAEGIRREVGWFLPA
ncbi:transketolase [Nocardioides caldifontis]|uniref:transketolase n=1 Tax=Nocardioides caldifontis TaxID=2588938 RepID=UPI0011DF49CE|nr:transketolase [Nocardioides caldifontis]